MKCDCFPAPDGSLRLCPVHDRAVIADAALLRSFDAFIASYEGEWGAGDWGYETAMLKRVRSVLGAL